MEVGRRSPPPPALLFHGKKDTVVSYYASKKMYKRLKELKLPVRFIEVSNVAHSCILGLKEKHFDAFSDDVREKAFQEILQFIAHPGSTKGCEKWSPG